MFFAQQANAAVTININESGGNVTAVLSGNLNLGATLGYVNESNGFNGVAPSGGNISFTSASSSYYLTSPAWTPIGTGGFFNWDSSSGSAWHMFSPAYIGVPNGYVSGTALSATATKNSTNYAALGLTPGSYVTTLTNGAVSDTVTVNVIARADLRVTKVDSPDPVFAGETLLYTVTVFNDGPLRCCECVGG